MNHSRCSLERGLKQGRKWGPSVCLLEVGSIALDREGGRKGETRKQQARGTAWAGAVRRYCGCSLQMSTSPQWEIPRLPEGLLNLSKPQQGRKPSNAISLFHEWLFKCRLCAEDWWCQEGIGDETSFQRTHRLVRETVQCTTEYNPREKAPEALKQIQVSTVEQIGKREKFCLAGRGWEDLGEEGAFKLGNEKWAERDLCFFSVALFFLRNKLLFLCS